MIKFKNFKRTAYESFNLHIYAIIPLIIILIYLVSNLKYGFNLAKIKTLNENIISISLTLSGILITLLGLFLALPNTDFRKLMRRYNHDKIVNNTLIIGVLSLLATTLLASIEKLPVIVSLLFLIGFTEVVIASIWIYQILRNINN